MRRWKMVKKMQFPKPELFPLDANIQQELKYAVVCAHYQGKWMFCRHKFGETWELPGGHIEPGETPMEAARRELYEETGAVEAEITPVGIYKLFDYGLLCYADVKTIAQIPADSEIGQMRLFQSLPYPLTYKNVHDQLFAWVQEWLANQPTV